MHRSAKAKYMTLAVLLALVTATYALLPILQVKIGREKKTFAEKNTLFYLPSRAFMKIFSLGFEQIIADYFWIKAVTYSETDALDKVFVMNDSEMHEYLEAQPVTRQARQRVYQMLVIATSFDPNFLYAYEFGGTLLAWSGDVELANSILTRGTVENRNDPRAWKIFHTLAFNTYFFKKDYEAAARYMLDAARLTKGKYRTTDMAATLFLAGRRYDLAIRMLQSLHDNASDEDMRRLYEERIKYFIVERDLYYLNEALKVFISRYHVQPLDVNALVQLSILPGIPKEPFGGKYVINNFEKRVENAPYRRNRVILSLEESPEEMRKKSAEITDKIIEQTHDHEGENAHGKESGHEHPERGEHGNTGH